MGVVDQGGDGYGAAQAFKPAGRPTPDHHHGQSSGRTCLVEGTEGANGYETWSASIAPGISTLAFWVAQQVLDGNKDIPHDLVVPYLRLHPGQFRGRSAQDPGRRRRQHEYTQTMP